MIDMMVSKVLDFFVGWSGASAEVRRIFANLNGNKKMLGSYESIGYYYLLICIVRSF